MDPTNRRLFLARLAALGLLCLAGASPAPAGVTGKITGRILGTNQEPILGVTVLVVGARLGAFTDEEGRFHVLNVPAGAYQLKAQLIGFRPLLVTDVVVNADQTTRLDLVMQEAAVEVAEIVVSGEAPVVDVHGTGTLATVTRREIEALPVQELQDIVNLQAGVVDGHFRGGRSDEVQYQVDGVSVNNSYDNASSLRLDRSVLEEVQVISGTFDAEYGQAMSGVVNAVLRRGGDRFEWDGEVFLGSFLYPGHEEGRLEDFQLRPTGIQNYQFSLSGPTGLPRTNFLGSLRRYVFDDYVYGTRTFLPTDRSDFANQQYSPSGDGSEVPLGTSREWSGAGKVTHRPMENAELGYQAIFNEIEGTRMDWAYRLLPDGLSRQQTFSIVHGLSWTHSLGKNSFYDLSVRQNYFNYEDLAYEDFYDARYDSSGAPTGDPNFENGAYVQGVSFTRFHQNTNALVCKGSGTHQFSNTVLGKGGLEFQLPRLEFGPLGHLVYTTQGGTQTLVRHANEPPDYPGLSLYFPVLAAAFAQAEVEWNDLAVRAGLRFDSFDARSTVPSDPANPANSIAGAPASVSQPTTVKQSFSPRLGVSQRVSRRASIYFAYGHFSQLPGLGQIFSNTDYSILADLAAGGVTYGVFGNPDVKPEKTIQYQGGYKQALTDDFGLDVTVFYKDIRDLLGVEFITTYNNAEYARLTNADFGSALGFTLALHLRPDGLFGGSLDYTWQQAEGNSSDPRETATRAEAGEDPRPRLIPLDWDQRHTLNVTASFGRPGSLQASAVFRIASGQPYTPTLDTGFGGGLETNSGRKPAGALLDLRAERQVPVRGARLGIFARIWNLFDTRFFNGFVFSDTGSPYYSRNPAVDEAMLENPTRFYGPRRLELGVRLGGIL